MTPQELKQIIYDEGDLKELIDWMNENYPLKSDSND